MSSRFLLFFLIAFPFFSPAASIVENKGQVREQSNETILYYSAVNGGTVYFLKDRISFVLSKVTQNSEWNSIKTGSKKELYRYDMKLEGMEISTGEALPEKINYYTGNQHFQVQQFQKIIYTNKAKGISLFFYDHPGKGMKYDILFDHPQAGTSVFSYELDGAMANVNIGPGEKEILEINTPMGKVIESFPVVYTDCTEKKRTKRTETKCRISINKNHVSYETEIPENCTSAVIDPWTSFAGGGDVDECYGTDGDKNGNVYISGYTLSPDFPSSPGAFQTGLNANYDAYLFKFDANGQRLWATYYGGSMDDFGYRLKVSPSGKPTLSGYTYSSDLFVSSSGVFSSSFSGLIDGFITQFDASGNFLWGTFVGGTGGDFAIGMDLDKLGFIALSGFTSSNDFPVSPSAWQATAGGALDCFLAKFDSTGNRVWATYMGGTNSEDAHAIKFDSFGNVIIAGDTYSNDFPVSPTAYQNFLMGAGDAYLAKFSNSGTYTWSTFLGGSANEDIEALACDAENNIYFTGYSSSADFPVTSGAYQSTMNGVRDLAAGSFGPGGNLRWLTFAGGSSWDFGRGIIVNTNNKITICGETSSMDFPTVGSMYDTINNGVSDVVYMTLDTAGTVELLNLSGGSNADYAHDICEVKQSAIVIAGNTYSADFPVTTGVFQTTQQGDVDAFAWQIDTTSIITFVAAGNEPGTGYLYPNPASSKTIITNIFPGNYNLSIFDSNGKLVRLEAVNSNGTLEITGLESVGPGLYSIFIRSAEKFYRFRLVKTM